MAVLFIAVMLILATMFALFVVLIIERYGGGAGLAALLGAPLVVVLAWCVVADINAGRRL